MTIELTRICLKLLLDCDQYSELLSNIEKLRSMPSLVKNAGYREIYVCGPKDGSRQSRQICYELKDYVEGSSIECGLRYYSHKELLEMD